MNKKTIKPILMSALTALAFGSVGAAGTFALFTDNANTTVSIQAGKVEVSSGVTIQKAYSLNSEDATLATSTTHASYVNGGQADVSTETGNVQIQRWTPGDGLKLRTAPVNSSNVNILTRFKINLAGTLAPALEIRVRAKDAQDSDPILFGRIGAGQLVSDWVSVEYDAQNPNHPAAYDIDIVFPDHDNGELKFGEDNKDNQYMTATATVVITYEAVQGNANLSANLLDRLNTTLATESINDGGMNKTMHDAMADIPAALATEAAIEAAGYVWNYETDQFYDFGNTAPADAYKYFKIADDADAAGNYSIYASADWATSPVTVSGKGFDVGTHAGDIASVTYNGLGETNARTNIIRTNSLDTDVVAEAPYDTVKHYGDAHTVTIHDIANHSYHEFGRVALLDVARGRVALEKGSDVKNLHFTAAVETTTKKTFDAITVAYDEAVTLPTFSRDTVDIAAEGTLVVELQNSVVEAEAESDYVWLFQQGLKEQIRITEEIPTEQVAEKVRQAPKSTDSGVAAKTSVAAEQIANNLSGAGNYTSYADLVAHDALNEDGSVKNEVLVAQNAIIEDVGVEQNAEAKAAALEEKVEETISVIANTDTSANYVVRIKSKFYESFWEAFGEVKSGDTIRVLAGNNVNADNTYDVTGKNITINVEKGATLAFGSVTNNKFEIGWNNNSGRLDFEGEGKITFGKDNNYTLVNCTGSQGSSRVTFRGLTVEASASGALLTNGLPVYIESGCFKNIGGNGYTHISGGMFDINVSAVVEEGKMCVNDSGDETYPWIVRDLDAAHALFSVSGLGSETKYFTTFKGANDAMAAGKTLTFIGNHSFQINDATWWFRSGGIYDFAGNSFTQGNTQYHAIGVDYGNDPVTLKNGTIHAAGSLIEEGAHIIVDNVRFDDHVKAAAFGALSGNGYYVKDAADTFVIKTEAPAEYAAKITRLGSNPGELYFVGENAVKNAVESLNADDSLLINVNDSGVYSAPVAVNGHFYVSFGIGVESYPTINAQNGETSFTTDEYGVRDYKVDPQSVCEVNGIKKDTIENGFKALNNSGGELKLLTDAYPTGMLEWTIGADTTINFNGHNIYGIEDDYTSSVLKILGNSSHKLTLENEFEGEAVYDENGLQKGGIQTRYVSQYYNSYCIQGIGLALANGGNNTTVEINGGTYVNNGDVALFQHVGRNSGSLTLNDGCFVNYNVLQSGGNLTVNGGIFRSELFTSAFGVAKGELAFSHEFDIWVEDMWTGNKNQTKVSKSFYYSVPKN